MRHLMLAALLGLAASAPVPEEPRRREPDEPDPDPLRPRTPPLDEVAERARITEDWRLKREREQLEYERRVLIRTRAELDAATPRIEPPVLTGVCPTDASHITRGRHYCPVCGTRCRPKGKKR